MLLMVVVVAEVLSHFRRGAGCLACRDKQVPTPHPHDTFIVCRLRLQQRAHDFAECSGLAAAAGLRGGGGLPSAVRSSLFDLEGIAVVVGAAAASTFIPTTAGE